VLNKNALDNASKVKLPSTRRQLGDATPHRPIESDVARLSDEVSVPRDATQEGMAPPVRATHRPGPGLSIEDHRLRGTVLACLALVVATLPILAATGVIAGSTTIGIILGGSAALLLGLWSISQFKQASDMQRLLRTEANAVSSERKQKQYALH